MTSASSTSRVNWPVFIGSSALIMAITAWTTAMPNRAYALLEAIFLWVGENLGWYYILTAGIIVTFALVVAFSPLGKTKLGPDHAKPRYSLFTWSAMLFAAGISVDTMFFTINGPATNIATAPGQEVGSAAATENAVVWTLFHYGVPGWAMYALMGMAFALFAYRYHMPLSIRSALSPIIGKRADGAAGHSVEIATVISTIFGMATILGIGVVFLNFGLEYLFGIPQSLTAQVSLILVAVGVATFSTVSGVDKGIRRLAEINVLLVFLLLLYVLIVGETVNLLNAMVKNLGDFFSSFPGMLFETFAYDQPEGQWLEWWTVFFWAFWIAVAPFIGLFLARISRGRTLRQFIIGVLLIPFGFTGLMITVFGNGAIFRILDGDVEFSQEALQAPESGYYLLLQEYPGGTFIIALSVLVGLLFYVTSADSAALVLSNFTSKTENVGSDGPPWLRIFWSFATGALTLTILMLDGVETLQMATVIIGLPISVLAYLLMISIWRALRMENLHTQSRTVALHSAISERSAGGGEPARGQWRRRLARGMRYPELAEVSEFLEHTAFDAVEEVAQELRSQGLPVRCERGEVADTSLEHLDLHVDFHGVAGFKYQVYPVAYSTPNFARSLHAPTEYWKVEVFTANGSDGRNIYGYSKTQVIADLIDAYERHIGFLTLQEEDGGGTRLPVGTTPDDWDYDRTRES